MWQRVYIAFLFWAYASHSFAQPFYILDQKYKEKYPYLDSLHDTLGSQNITNALYTLDHLEKWADDHGDREFALEFLLMKNSISFVEKYNSTLSETTLQNIALEAHNKRYFFLEAKALQTLGDYNIFVLGKRAFALENYLVAYKLYSRFPDGEFPDKREYLYKIGSEYYRYGDIDNSLKYLKEGLALKGPDKFFLSVCNTIGLCYRKLKQYDSSEWYFKMTNTYALQHNKMAWVAISWGNLGSDYFLEGRYDEAIPLLERDIEISSEHQQLQEAISSMGILSSVFYMKKQYDSSERLIICALQMAKGKTFWPNYHLAEQLYSQMYKTLAAKNDMRGAYYYADSALIIKDSIASIYSALDLSKAKENAELVQKKIETEQLNSLKARQLLIRNFLVGTILLIMIIAFLLIRQQKLRQKQLEAEKKNAESELKIAVYQLENFTKNIREKNTIVEKVSSRYSDVTDDADLEILLQLEKAIILTDEQWDHFRDLFEKVHKGFFTNLRRKIPDLTQAEIRFLALTKLKLSSKEMASMLGISPNAIRIYRHRLRKKLNLDKDDMIEELIEKI